MNDLLVCTKSGRCPESAIREASVAVVGSGMTWADSPPDRIYDSVDRLGLYESIFLFLPPHESI